MSRAKIGHEFCPTPRKWHAGWANHSGPHARGVRNSLFELTDGAPIPVHGADWLESLCKQMQFHGRERPNVRKTLKAFEADGLIAWDGAGLVLVCFLPGAELVRPVVDRSPFVVDSSSTGSRVVTDRLANGHPLNIPLGSTPQNDSGHVSQTDRRDRKKEESERAGARAHAHAREATPIVLSERAQRFERPPLPEPPPDLPPAEPPLAERILSAHAKRYSELRGGESCKRDYRAARDLGVWCEANAHVHKTTPIELALRVVAGLFASEKAQQRRWPLSWASHDPAEYLSAPAGCKPVVSAQERKPVLEAHQVWKPLEYFIPNFGKTGEAAP